ncbi:synaptotagmin beta isoform X2 [Rhodnius prolixus]|uniref:synaptotagmin beta isoform X2 n=1 Tax=Rhodnius prolixus TaxID=13249 RepID=UPI003D18D915
MVASAVLGAATGTGLALLVAMTLVLYRYYASRRYGKDWGDVERFGVPQGWNVNRGVGRRRAAANNGQQQGLAVTTQKIFNVAKEETTVQPSSPSLQSVAPALEVTGGLQATLCRTTSVSSHASVDSNTSRQSTLMGRTLSPECRSSTEALANVHRTRPLSPLLMPQDSTTSIVTTCCSGRDVPSSPLPLGTLQPALYTRPEGPVVVRSENRVGRLHITTKYDFDRSDLHVHLIESEGIVGGEFSEPYIRLNLDPPVDNRVRQTGTKSESSPLLDQHYKFPVSHDELPCHSLVIQVFDYDRYSRNDIIGQLRIDLAEIDTTSTVEIWGDISKIRKPPEELQEVLVSLNYLPSAERLTVVILKAKNLSLPEHRDTIDPFVKVYLLASGKRVKKRKTACRKSCINPVWNEAITFNICSSNLMNSSVEICVLDQGSDLIGGPYLIGSLIIGPEQQGISSSHWSEMLASPRKSVAMWHTLR